MRTLEQIIKESQMALYDKSYSKEDYIYGTTSWTLKKEVEIRKDNIRLYTFWNSGCGNPDINNRWEHAIHINYEIAYIIEWNENHNKVFKEFVEDYGRRNSFTKTEAEFEGVLESKQYLKKRKEQSFLRNHLFNGNDTGVCSICGMEYPIEFLVTAHIKKRAKAGEKEKRDTNIVIPMCKFGCDDLFEHGYISVANGKVVNITNKKPTTPMLETYIKKLEGKPCSYWNDKNKVYFEWHYAYHSYLQDET